MEGRCDIIRGRNSVQPVWESHWKFLRKLEIPLHPAIPLLGFFSNTLKTSYYSDTHTPMFIEAQSMIAASWKWHIRPRTDEWMRQVW